MRRDRRQADAARRRRATRRTRSSRSVPEEVPGRHRLVRRATPGGAAADQRPYARLRGAPRAPAGRGHRDRRRGRARVRIGEASAHLGRKGAADRHAHVLGRRARRRPDDAAGRRATGQGRARPRLHRRPRHAERRRPADADRRVPSDDPRASRARRRCSRSPRRSGGQSFSAASTPRLREVYQRLGLAARPQVGRTARSRTCSPAAPRCSCSSAAGCRCSGSGGSV